MGAWHKKLLPQRASVTISCLDTRLTPCYSLYNTRYGDTAYKSVKVTR